MGEVAVVGDSLTQMTGSGIAETAVGDSISELETLASAFYTATHETVASSPGRNSDNTDPFISLSVPALIAKGASRIPDSVRRLPFFAGDWEQLKEINQGEFGISDMSAEKPILATDGVGPCIAVVGYDAENRMGFVLHADYGPSLHKSMGDLLYHLRSCASNGQVNCELVVLSGWSSEDSNDVLSVMAQFQNRYGKEVSFRVTHKELGRSLEGMSIALDVRDGTLYQYSPKDNPAGISVSAYDIVSMHCRMMERLFGEGMTLAYSSHFERKEKERGRGSPK